MLKLASKILNWIDRNTNERFGWAGPYGNWFCTFVENVDRLTNVKEQ